MSNFLVPPRYYDSDGNIVKIFDCIVKKGGVAIGEGAVAGNKEIAIGAGAKSSNEHQIQIGENNTRYTAKIGDGSSSLSCVQNPVGFFVGQIVPESGPESGKVSYPEGFVPKTNHLYLVDVAVSGTRQKAMIHRSSAESYFFANFKDAAASSINTICYKVEWDDANKFFKISGGEGVELKIFFIYDIALLKDDSQYASTATFNKENWYEFWNDPFELTLIMFGDGEDVQYNKQPAIDNVMGANFKNTNRGKPLRIDYKIGQQENSLYIEAGQSTTFYFTKDIEFLSYEF